MHKLNLILSLASLLSTVACTASQTPSGAVSTAAPPSAVRRAHVETHPTQGPQRVIEGASATLAITGEGAMASIATSGLTPGHVYTLWFVAINAPDQCSSSPCKAPDVLGKASVVQSDIRWADGAVADAKGTIELTGWVPTGPWSEGWFGNGLTNIESGEVHLVVNDHGPVLAGRESAMLTSVREGCTDDSVPRPYPSVAKNHGAAGPNRCALVQDAIFVPAR
jgi:hypothetical protein